MLTRPPGRPTPTSNGGHTILTPELADQLLSIIGRGHYINAACASVGITKQTLSHWRKLAEQGVEPYTDLIDRLKTAYEAAEVALGDKVLAAADLPQHWPAAMTYLERTRPEKYGRRDQGTQVVVTQFVFRNEEIGKGDVVEVESRVVSEIAEKASE